ncbi:hypothetical protein [Clostridioides difficile]|uniref:hypothetical protein n=1 Tax=Clostridioides difficile TaxID=1496 RepID=UPI00307FF5A7
MRTKYEKRELSSNDSSRNLLESIGEYWGAFYLANPHRFCMDYFGFNLHLFQQILIYMMMKSDQFVFIASRGLGKSWLLGVFCCVIAVLKPGTCVLIAAKRKKQAKLLITSKILGDLYLKSDTLKREIKSFQVNAQEVSIDFWNGSRIEAVVSNDDARGYRANVLIVDEYRMVDEGTVNDVLVPFLTNPRQPGYLQNPKYRYMQEENKEIYLSSGWYSQHWSYKKFMETVKGMLSGEDMFACSIPFTCSLEHGLLTKKRILKEMKKESMSDASFMMEYCGVFYNESDDAFFKSSWVNPCRVLESMFYPPSDIEYLENKKKRDKKYHLNKIKGEIRIIGADIALARGVKNDNSIYTLMRMLPNEGTYKRCVVHIEAYNGMEAEKQAIRLKQLFSDFQADYMILDTQGIGTTVWSYIQKANYDSDRDEWYDAYTCFNEDNTVDKSLAKKSLPVVYSMKAYADENHKMAMSLRDVLTNRTLELPISDIEAKEMILEKEMIKADEIDKKAELEAKYIAPYLQTTALVNELINLEYSADGGKIKIKEKSGARKDRYSSLAYTNFLADYLEEKEKRKNRNNQKNVMIYW